MPRSGRPRSFDEDAAVERAMETFWERGYSAASMRVLSDELNVLPGSLHAAFGSKRTLFLRSLADFDEMSRTATEPLASSDDPLEAVRDILCSVLDSADAHPGRGCMLGNTAIELLPQDEEARGLVRAGLGAFEDGIETALRAAQAHGGVGDRVDCRAQARLLVALIQGLHVIARAEVEPGQLRDIIDTALEAIIAH